MPVSRIELDQLGAVARAQLAEDLAQYGRRAVGLTRTATRSLVGHNYRADSLHAWLRAYGAQDPRRGATPPRTERVQAPGAPTSRTHVIFGDAHAAPGQDLRRFSDMGRIVRAELDRATGPIVVIQIGDWYSMDALCTHEAAGKRGRGRLREDIEAGELAIEAYHRGLGVVETGAVEHHITLGNHDVRVAALADDAPWLEGIYSVGAAHEARGWAVHPYRDPARIDGVRYQHDLPARGGRRAIGGVNHARSILARVLHHESVVVGHSHRFQYHTERSHLGRRVHGLVVGCWLDHHEAYAGPDNEEWWSGHVVLRGVNEGDWDTMETHRRQT